MAFWGGAHTQGPTRHLLEVTVDRCYNLEDRGPFASEYSCVLMYGGSTRRTQPCFGRGTHPVFEEKFVFEFTPGVVELNVWVLTNQPSGTEEVIGFLRVELQQLLSNGYVDSTWTLQRTDGRPAGSIRLTLQFPSSSTFQGQDSNYGAPTLDSTAPLGATQVPILYQLLPYDARPPPRPALFVGSNAPFPPNSPQPNGTGPAALWSQLLPYGSPPSAAPACAYNPTTNPPLGYPPPQYPMHPPTPPGLSLSSYTYPHPPR